MMRAYDVIFKKRNGGILTGEEIDFFIGAYTKGDIPDYQASAFLMAVYFQGMDGKETACLTQAMAGSGEILDLSSVPGVKVDKHSTGGVGDGTSLVLAPLAAACGVPVPMISGRGLGHTGGTLDKLESIPGFRVGLTREEFLDALKTTGAALAGQTAELAPADRKFYALRDVTATVESVPLISASILSKKIAEGCDALVMDVKTGSGAFMRDPKDALRLAKTMAGIARRARKKMVSLITSMDEPLGWAVGNALEVRQAVDILKGEEDPRCRSFIELVDALGGWMLFLGRAASSSKDGREKIRAARKNGAGLAKWREIVQKQGGDPAVCEYPDRVLPQASQRKTVLSPWKGTLGAMNARSVGLAALVLGAGREKQEDRIDPAAGVVLFHKVGDRVERGEALAELHTSDSGRLDAAEKLFLSSLKVGKFSPRPGPVVRSVVR